MSSVTGPISGGATLESGGPWATMVAKLRPMLTRARHYASESAIPSVGSFRILNISFNEQSCNLNCRVCGFSTDKIRTMYARPSRMQEATLNALVEALPNHRGFWFDISAIAETLQFANLAAFIADVKRRRPKINTIISTNGTLLTEKVCHDLVSSGLDFIQFSLYAPDAEGYAFITQSRVPFDRVLANLDALIEARGTQRKPVIHGFIYDTLDFKERAKPLLARYRGRIDDIYFRHLYDTVGVTGHGLRPKAQKERYPCPALWFSGAVRSNGDLLRCYSMHWFDREHKLGNIHEDDLRSYWRKLGAARTLHAEGRWDELPGCKDCDVWAQQPSFFSKRKDGTFYIPKHRLLLSFLINGLRRYVRREGYLVSH